MDRPLPPVSAIADVLALWGCAAELTPPLAPVVVPAEPVGGRVLTVEVAPGGGAPGWGPMYDLLSGDLSDRLVVIAGAHRIGGAVWGEILTDAARRQGAAAVLVDGWVRDVPELLAMGLPVYGSGRRVVGPNGGVHVSGTDVAVQIGEVTVEPADFVVSDAMGCVRIPADLTADALAAAQHYAAAEERVLQAMEAGEPLATAYRHKKLVVDELRR